MRAPVPGPVLQLPGAVEVPHGAAVAARAPHLVLDMDVPSPPPGVMSNGSEKPPSLTEVVRVARDKFRSGVTRSLAWRRDQLRALLRLYTERRDEMLHALHADLRRCKQEGVLLEVEYLVSDLENTLHELEAWAAPEYPAKTLVNVMDEVVVVKEPYGVALVIGAWNYPLQLLLLPAAGAIAAGNAVVLKPSELAPQCAQFVAQYVPQYLDREAVAVVQGGPAETAALLQERFDYIFYTGGAAVGRIVHAAANRHLTPLTLELGGKSPVYIDESVLAAGHMEVCVKRVLWGKLINAGQTCIAPDYVLCTRDVQERLVSAARRVLRDWYGEDAQRSPDLARIVNERHWARLNALLERSRERVALGGAVDRDQLYIEPTLLADVTPADAVMQEEIFGPILPIVPVDGLDHAIDFINEREKPLVLYGFSALREPGRRLAADTSSGGLCLNDTVMHMAVDTLPFGGVGLSGQGAYHGRATFDTFSHRKSCLLKTFNALGEKLASGRYPPYSERKLSTLLLLMRKRTLPSLRYVPHALLFLAGLAAAHLAHLYTKHEAGQH